MLLIPCPYCGERPEIEFTHGGEAHLIRPAPPAAVDEETWTQFLYMRSNLKGPYAERWRHARGCGKFFNAVRDTTTDHFIAVYKTGERAPTQAAPVPAAPVPAAPVPTAPVQAAPKPAASL